MDALRAVAYFRMSTGFQEASIPEQREWSLSAAKQHGITIAREFADHGISGSEIESRPGLMALVNFVEAEHAQKRPASVLVAWDLDRLSRASSIRTAAVLDRLMQAGVSRILTAEGWTDLTEDMDLLLLNVKQDLARAGFSKSIAKNVTRNAAERAAKGWLVAGRAPYGYRVRYVKREVKGRMKDCPESLILGEDDAARRESETVRWIFARYATTALSLGELCRELIEMDAPAPHARRGKDGRTIGGKWNRHTVHSILTNRVYLGEKVWGAVRQGKYYQFGADGVESVRGGAGRRRCVNAPPDQQIVVKDAHPALVDPQTFKATQERLRASRWKRTTPQAGGGEWILSGMVYCGCCGGRMIGHTQRHRRGEKTYTYRRYVCRGNFRHGQGTCRSCAGEQDVLVREIVRIIRDAFAGPRLQELQAELERAADRSAVQTEKERHRLTARVASLDRDIAAASERILLVPPDLMQNAATALRKMQVDQQEARHQLARLDAAAEAGEAHEALVREAVSQLLAVEDAIADRSPGEVRDMLSQWVDKVTLHFEPPVARRNGYTRNVLSHIDIDFASQVAYLLPSGATRRC